MKSRGCYFSGVDLKASEKRKKKFQKKLDNTKKISTFAIPNTGSLNDGVVKAIKNEIEALIFETETWNIKTRGKLKKGYEDIYRRPVRRFDKFIKEMSFISVAR